MATTTRRIPRDVTERTIAAAQAALARRIDAERRDAPYEWSDTDAAARYIATLESITISADRDGSVVARAERNTGTWGYVAAEILDGAAADVPELDTDDTHLTEAARGGWRLTRRPTTPER